MPTAPSITYVDGGLVPYYPNGALVENVKLPNSQVYSKGQILAEQYGTDEVQTITLATTNSDLGGTYTLTFGGQTTSAINYNATAAQVQTALQGLSSIGANNVTVTGTTPTQSAGGVLTVTFVNALGATNVAQITADGSSLTGTNASITPATTTPGTAGTHLWYAWDSTQTDGRQIPKKILQYDCATDSSGNHTWGGAAGSSDWNFTLPYVPAFFSGYFWSADLVGLTEAALAVSGGHLIMNSGSILTGGVVQLF